MMIVEKILISGLRERFDSHASSLRNNDQFLIPFIETLTNLRFKTGMLQADQTALKSIIVFACLMEGLFFYVDFVQILALARRNKTTSAAEQYQYILCDESTTAISAST
jgi:ribonucleoside-diphosphate reductase beta chain